jgi:predicted permease
LRELRQALRGLGARPVWTLVVVLTLGLGIGANGAVASLVQGVFLRALPYPEAERLVLLEPLLRGEATLLSYPDFRDLEEILVPSPFEGLAAFAQRPMNVEMGEEGVHVSTELVSAGTFGLLGHLPRLGRGFSAEEHAGRPAVILGDALWRRHFGDLRGEELPVILLEGRPFPVVGVMGPEFVGLSPSVQLWLPVAAAEILMGPEFLESREVGWLEVVARREPGQGLEIAAAAAAGAMEVLVERNAESPGLYQLQAVPLREAWFGGLSTRVRGLAVSAALVFLLALANASGLFWARGVEWRREVALRSALGATRGWLLRRPMAESLLLAVAGAGAALLFARGVPGVLLGGVELDPRGLVALEPGLATAAAVILLALGSGLLFGFLPTLWAARLDLRSELMEGGSGGGFRGRRFDHLVIVEVALAFLLLYGALAAAERFRDLADRDLGYEAEGLLTLRLHLGGPAYASRESRVELARDLLDTLEATPGVAGVALVGPHLPGDTERLSLRLTIEDWEGEPEAAAPYFQTHRVSADYFDLLGIETVAGRSFGVGDGLGAGLVAVLSASAAERCWPGRDPLGRRLKPGTPEVEAPPVTVVGVVEDIVQEGFARSAELPQLYLYLGQVPPAFPPTLNVLVRPEGGGGQAFVERLRETVRGVAPGLPAYDIETLDRRLAAQLVGDRALVRLLSGFTLLALLLAAAGIYGLLSTRLAASRREMGVRLALGCRPRGLFVHTLGRGLTLALRGSLAGAVGALVLSRLLGGRMGEDLAEPWLLGPVAGLLLAVGALAAAGPAIRSARVDVLRVLREE